MTKITSGGIASGLHLDLLRAEISAARIEAVLRAEPEIGRLWRTEAAFGEAVRSVGLEDVRLSEGDLVARLTLNELQPGDPRGLELAAAILRVLRLPGDFLGDPVGCLRRIEAAAAPVGASRDMPDILDDAEVLQIAAEAQGLAEMPVAAAIRAAASYAIRSNRQSPAAERLLFVAVEGSARGRSFGETGEAAPRDRDDLSPLASPLSAAWIVTPSTALSRLGFRIWSPLRHGSVGDLAKAIAESLAWDMGQLGMLRHHVARIRAMGEGRHGRSRAADMATFVLSQPVFSSAMAAAAIGITRRAALNLIAEMEGAGVIRLVTPRRAARLWATASLADRLRTRSLRAAAPRTPARAAAGQGASPEARGEVHEEIPIRQRALAEENREGMERAMADLDRALAEADEILRGLPSRR
ncbi:helix-turn-helix domain-containing protein [Defluviimonas salinarum]|uniref:Helix-turn-helix domain-containing protein n=1 Tax=Defluviimonas salinarum TaxID=2992147 RepID=A0ABT3JAL2_9RHOB|nr:helix-turn-helix domain-containing protein [Defluviimonas salinarum]MCW3784449.1 helix-turn-helix domain-containing protein [Defluviimonas salinarum]